MLVVEYSQEDDDALRLRLGERVPSPGSDADTMFSLDEITAILAASASLLQATVLGWQMKAAELARLVDTAEGDSSRKLSQRYAQAEKMVKVWQVHLATYEGDPAAHVPVVGVPIEYLRPNEDEPTDPPHPFPNYPFGF